jgi:hypothetical protein
MWTLSSPTEAVIPSGAAAYLTGGSGGTSQSWALASVAPQSKQLIPRKREVLTVHPRRGTTIMNFIARTKFATIIDILIENLFLKA